jgi:serine/threonine protein kinase
VPPPDLPAEQRATLRQRTLREARAAARITSPAAVTVYDVVEEDGRPWIVMELLRARTLAQVVRDDGPLPPPPRRADRPAGARRARGRARRRGAAP